MKASHFEFYKLTLAKSVFVKLSLSLSDYSFIKKVISTNCDIFVLANVFLGLATPHSCLRSFSGKGGGIQVLEGTAPSGSLSKNPWLAERIENFGKK